MEKKNHSVDRAEDDSDGGISTIPFIVPESFKRPEDTPRQPDSDLTTPNIPFPDNLKSMPFTQARDSFDLTEMRVRAFDPEEEDVKSVVGKPERYDDEPAIAPTRTKSQRRRRVPLWIWLAGSGLVLLFLGL